MKILVFNTGSTSLRFAVIDLKSDNKKDFSQYQTLASGIVRDIGSEEAVLKEQENKQTVDRISITAKDYSEASRSVWQWLKENYPDSVIDLDAVGHRVVHGGHFFDDHVVIDKDVISKIESLADIAPLHNPPAVEVIRAAKDLLPQTPMVAVFDTVFHRTIPETSLALWFTFRISGQIQHSALWLSRHFPRIFNPTLFTNYQASFKRS